mmetsp:Transcript_19192/g.27916  ORF Transcript_19192/g.27916 Transcript_19192/m.27916 type:complete len:102 (-) Transcript_19192:165-470(-)
MTIYLPHPPAAAVASPKSLHPRIFAPPPPPDPGRRTPCRSVYVVRLRFCSCIKQRVSYACHAKPKYMRKTKRWTTTDSNSQTGVFSYPCDSLGRSRHCTKK